MARFRLAYDNADLGLGQDVAHTIVGVAQIQRNIASASLEHAQDCKDRQLRAVEQQPDKLAGTDAEPAQMVRDPVRSLFDLIIGE